MSDENGKTMIGLTADQVTEDGHLLHNGHAAMPAPMAPPPLPPAGPMRAIDRARSSYYRTRERMVVEEWADGEGKPLEVYFNAVTAADIQSIAAKDPKTRAEEHALLIIQKARDEQNKPLFSPGDLPILLAETEYTVLYRIFEAMNALTSLKTVDDAKNATGATPA